MEEERQRWRGAQLSSANFGSPEWARFDDWLRTELGVEKEWTVVAELTKVAVSQDHRYTQEVSTASFLCPNSKKAVATIFDHPSRLISEAMPSIDVDSTPKKPRIVENSFPKGRRFFVTRRQAFGEAYPTTWRLGYEIEDYFNLRTTDHGSLVDPQTRDLVVKIPSPATSGPVLIRTDYLREFLAAWKKVLVRQHEITRHWSDPIKDVSEHEGSDTELNRVAGGVYLLEIRNSQTNEYLRDSWLLAKDVVRPYSSSGGVGRYKTRRVPTSRQPDFIVDRKGDGTLIRRKPTPHDFTAAYFDPRVLKKYFDEPSRYHVGFHAPGMGGLGQIDSWSMSIGRNEEGFVIAWLADLVKQQLPEEEIKHWGAHNVPPQGGMAIDFYGSQMMCKAPEAPSLESKLRDCRGRIQKFFREQGKEVYRPYSGPDVHAEHTLRIPLFNEHGEFRDCMNLLCRVFIECLNESLFKSELPDALTVDTEGNGLKGIKLFANWLQHITQVEPETIRRLQVSLDNAQMMRSKAGVAHRFSDSAYSEVLKKTNLPKRATAIQMFCSVAIPLADSLEEVCIALDLPLWWRKRGNPPT